MSAENVRVVRRLAEAFNDREVAAMLETLAPGAELHPLRAQLGARAYGRIVRGRTLSGRADALRAAGLA